MKNNRARKIMVLGVLLLILTACGSPDSTGPQTPPAITAPPTLEETQVPLKTPIKSLTPTILPSATQAQATATQPTPPTAETSGFSWGESARYSDDEILAEIEVPKPEEYFLPPETALRATEVIRSNGPGSPVRYVLFGAPVGQGGEAHERVYIAYDAESDIFQNMISVQGNEMRFMFPTNPTVIKETGRPFLLNSADLLAEQKVFDATEKALAFAWWVTNHPEDKQYLRSLYMESLGEIPGLEKYVDKPHELSRAQRRDMFDFMVAEFRVALAEARATNNPLGIDMRDKSGSSYDAAYQTFVIDLYHKPRVENLLDSQWGNIRTIEADGIDSAIFTLHIPLVTFHEYRIHNPLGGIHTWLLRSILIGMEPWTNTYFEKDQWRMFSHDLSGPILEAVCDVQNMSEFDKINTKGYPMLDGGEIVPPLSCAIVH